MNQETAFSRKKILFVVTKSNFGGAQRYVFDLATSLPKQQYEAVVVAGPAQGSTSPGELIDKLGAEGIRSIFVPEMGRDVSLSDMRALGALARIFKAEKPHAVHLNSSKAGALGALAARLFRVPRIIFTVHGWAFREPRSMLSRLLIYIASFLTVLWCHHIICISEYDRRAFARIPFLRAKQRLIKTGLREHGAALPRKEARMRLLGAATAHSDDVWVGSIGELTYNKNMKTALDAFSLARRSDEKLFYVIIGDGEQREKLSRYAERLELGTHTVFAGAVPDAANFLSAFDIFLLPSRKEGLPYVLLETAAAGVPVVASTAGGIPELVENGVSGALCAPTDTMGIADALTELARDPELRGRFADALKRKAAGEHDFERMLRATSSLYAP